jgi:hypothetical protein
MKHQSFRCFNCGQEIPVNQYMGTANRNHCPHCLWSKHVDQNPGDRKSDCHCSMEPIGLTFKQEGLDKYGNLRQGELMVIHRCLKDDKISINRIAADDDPEKILEVFQQSLTLNSETKEKIQNLGINLLTQKDEDEIRTQLFGKNHLKV